MHFKYSREVWLKRSRECLRISSRDHYGSELKSDAASSIQRIACYE